MGWTDDLNRAMGYIEENLRGEVSIAEVAKRAACSEFHLQRMFPYMTGMTLADYIRRRRMSLAALDLAAGDKVIDVALRYGYESPTSFARAFRDVHGVAPSDAQRGNASLKQHPRLAFTMLVKGEEAMEYRIEERGEFRVVGYLAEGAWTLENAGEEAEKFWARLNEDGGQKIHEALSLMDGSAPDGLLGVSFCDNGNFSGYLVGVATGAPCPERMEERIVPAATYAVFDCKGPMPDAMQSLRHRIYTEWLPSSGYEWAPKPDLEIYFGPRMTAADYRSQVWLPIQKLGE